LDPQPDRRQALARIAGHPINAVADLLPWNVAGSLAEMEQDIAARQAQ
jgi:hypothetical protein